MEHQLHIQRQKLRTDHHERRKTQTAFQQPHSGQKDLCRIAQSLSYDRHTAGEQFSEPQRRTIQLHRYCTLQPQ